MCNIYRGHVHYYLDFSRINDLSSATSNVLDLNRHRRTRRCFFHPPSLWEPLPPVKKTRSQRPLPSSVTRKTDWTKPLALMFLVARLSRNTGYTPFWQLNLFPIIPIPKSLFHRPRKTIFQDLTSSCTCTTNQTQSLLLWLIFPVRFTHYVG